MVKKFLAYCIIAFALVACPQEGRALPQYEGHDFIGLGSPSYNVAQVINALPAHSAIGTFDSTWPGNFGDPYGKVRQILTSGKVDLFRVHLWWSYQHTPATTAVVKKAAARWEALALQFPSVHCYLSPSAEYNYTATQVLLSSWISVLQQVAPHCTPVLSPESGAPVRPGVMIERHGTSVKGAQAVSTDGQDMFDADATHLIAANSSAVYFLAWGARYNLSVAGPFIPANQRTNAPSEAYIQGLQALFGVQTQGTMKYPQLYKTFAEDSGNSDPRSNKPLFIIREKVPFIQILDSHNTVLGKFPFYSSYLNQGWRYYSGSPGGMGKYAWEIGAIAKANTGSDVIKAKAGGQVYNVGSAAFRTPYYQK